MEDHKPLPSIDAMITQLSCIRCKTIICIGMPEERIYDYFVSTGANVTIYAVLDTCPEVVKNVLLKRIHPEHAHIGTEKLRGKVDMIYVAPDLRPEIYQRMIEIWMPYLRRYGLAVLPYTIDKPQVCFIVTEYTSFIGRDCFDVSIYSKYEKDRNDGWYVIANKE